MASCDTFHINCTGRGGHGSAPHLTVDPILACSSLVNSINTIVSRSHDPMVHSVVSVCSFHSGEASNVIPETAKISGTVRTFSKEAQDLTEQRLKSLCEGTEAGFGAKLELSYLRESPCVINNQACTKIVEAAARAISPAGVVTECLTMAAEDMSFFLNAVPGCFFLVGSAPEGREVLNHHTENFDFDEEALMIGASVLVQLVHDLMIH
eukprot:TRINITY_DN3408_c0_g1_i2.p2 TRINITY_DN3408_c0_g1~~TRINITY_DN3408_c0_g1_i2.p2  ORF type:complete len:209 (+),score=63.76 TRINITY_DN3408_c0_g1_i2:712-1338(+)